LRRRFAAPQDKVAVKLPYQHPVFDAEFHESAGLPPLQKINAITISGRLHVQEIVSNGLRSRGLGAMMANSTAVPNLAEIEASRTGLS